MLGANPRVPGSLLDEEEMGQLGAISAQLDASTEFGLRARCRFTARKSFVKLDCSTRVQSALLRKAKSIPKEYNMRDMVMYKKEQGALEPQDIWRGPARIIGFDKKHHMVIFRSRCRSVSITPSTTSNSSGTPSVDCHESTDTEW